MQSKLLIKLGTIAALALLLLFPIYLVQQKIEERAAFRHVAWKEVSASWTDRQTVVTPLIVLPYVAQQATQGGFITEDNVANAGREDRRHILVPDQVNVRGRLNPQQRHRGIYRIPVYTGTPDIRGSVNAQRLHDLRNAIAARPGFIEHRPAYLALLLTDPRGINRLPNGRWNNQPLAFQPGSGIPGTGAGLWAALPDSGIDGDHRLSLSLELNGMESLDFVPAALQANVSLSSGWPHPKFQGAFLPREHDIDRDGFTADWQVNQFSSDIRTRAERCSKGDCKSLDRVAFGVSLIDPVDVYLQSERATKYALLFVGLSFIVFFMFEVLKSLRIHPIQYTLVGLAISIFYLLLLSLSEHVSFPAAYATAATACVSLMIYYVRFILGAWKNAVLFGTMLGALYSVLYVIVQAEDFALLGGSILVLGVLSAIMITTRNIDWYQVATIDEQREAAPVAPHSNTAGIDTEERT